MAKLQDKRTADFGSFLSYIHEAIMSGSLSASFEDGDEWQSGDTRVVTRVYERYSYLGSNRVSLSLTLIGVGRSLELTAITSGGSQAVFWKLNTWGEEAFLEKLSEAIQRYSGA